MILTSILQPENIFELLQVLILSGIKFIFAAPLSMGYGFSWIQTIITTTIGGLLGVWFFFFLSKMIIRFFLKVTPAAKLYIKRFVYFIKNKPFELHLVTVATPKKKIFTKKNKLILKTKKSFGLWGIAALTPVLLSIPLGTFLASKYYKNKKKVLFSLSVSVACWSLIFSSISFIF